MKHKDKLLLPVMLAAALAAGPALAQSTSTQGGATGTTPTTPGMTSGTTAGTMHGGSANSVMIFRPRLSQLIGTNVYNDRNESIGEVDDILLAAPTGAGSMPPARSGAGTSGATTPGTATTGTTTPGTTTPGTATTGSTTMGSTGTTGSATTTPGTPATGTTMPGMSASGMQHGPMAVIQVGGFLGMGGRLVMVPLSELQWNAERERIILPNATKETLQGRPAFTYDSLRRG